jgi:hypothetical protein
LEVSEALGLVGEPDKERQFGVPSLLRRCLSIVCDTLIFRFGKEIWQFLEDRCYGVEAA